MVNSSRSYNFHLSRLMYIDHGYKAQSIVKWKIGNKDLQIIVSKNGCTPVWTRYFKSMDKVATKKGTRALKIFQLG